MDFATAWTTFDIGASVKASDGMPPPSTNTAGIPYQGWRSHNFTGTLVEKIDGDFRAMRFELAPNELGNVIGFTLLEGVGHEFAAAT